MKILFIQTGGTIDKDYASKAKTYNFEISKPAVEAILKNVNPNFDFEIKPLLKKDSLDLTEEDRNKIYEACINSKENKIIITHGTDTMVNTARVLSNIKEKTIILVGSSKPEKFYNSDAPFNLGTAIGAINVLNKGIYIAMNGIIYEWDKCKKKEDTGQFIEK